MKLLKTGVLLGFAGLAFWLCLACLPTATGGYNIPVTGQSTAVSITSHAAVPTTRSGGIPWVVRSLDLPGLCITAGHSFQTSFTVRNAGKTPLVIEKLGVAIYTSAWWERLPETSLPSIAHILLEPGEDYSFSAQTSIQQPGEYFAEPSIYADGEWQVIEGAARVWFEIDQQK